MDDRQLMERYPSAYRKIRAWMEANGNSPASPSDLVTALGFITREEVIRRILAGAEWAKEEGGGFVYVGQNVKQSSPVRLTAKAEDGPADRLTETVRRILKKESARNRIGVSATYLKHLTGNPPDDELAAILNSASWAVRQYGFYRFCEDGEPEPMSCEQLSMVSPSEETPLWEEEPAPASPPALSETGNGEADRTGSGEWQQLSMSIPDDEREEMRVGTVLRVKKRARTLSATVDFGSGLGKASVRVPSEQSAEPLVGKQVVCGVRMVGGEREVRLVGIGLESGLVAVSPTEQVRNGDRVE